MRLIDADALSAKMYHDAFETDSDMQKWDSGCWIRYKMFEKNLEDAPTIAQPEVLACGEGVLSAQQEDYAKLKREFLQMASYIDVLLECSDDQKETLMGFISRLAEFMPRTKRD